MVKSEEIAILFSRKTLKNEDEIFTPIKAMEGYYNDEFFIEKNGNCHQHIADFKKEGNGFACRIGIPYNASKEEIKKLKDKLLIKAKKYSYRRYSYQPEYVVMLDNTKKDSEEEIFQDIDTEYIYKCYQEYIEYFTNPENISEPYPKELPKTEPESQKKLIEMTPKELADKVKETVKGQDEAIDKIVTTIWMNLNYPELKKNNILVIGPSGSGKTYIFETISKILNIPITNISITGFSQAGFVGRDTETILSDIIINCNKNISLAEKSIVILDEIDKLAFESESRNDIATSGVQNELLKILEGDKRNVKLTNHGESYTINTEKITFVALGAFSKLYESRIFEKKNPIGFDCSNNSKENNKESYKSVTTSELIKYGMKRELIGRLPVLTELKALTKEDLKEIININLSSIIDIFNEKNIKITNYEELIELISEDAINKKVGARGLQTTITNIFYRIYYEVFSNDIKNQELYIGNNILNDYNDFYFKPKAKVKKMIKG